MNPRLKKIIFDKLNDDLSKAEIIVAENKSIWFVNRANKYWYYELEKSGKLWWRYEFFTDFFILFCLEVNEFQPLLSEWVEGVLNSEVNTSRSRCYPKGLLVEGVLNSEVNTAFGITCLYSNQVEGILNSEVNTAMPKNNRSIGVEGIFDSNINMTPRSGHRLHSTVEGILNHGYRKGSRKVDEVLNHKVVTTEYCGIIPSCDLEEVLNHKVVSISHANEQNELIQQILVHELIYEVESAAPLDTPAHDSVDEVLSYKVTRTIPDLNESLADVEIILNQKS